MIRMQSESLYLFCIGKNPGAITELFLRDRLEITVKIRLVGKYWTYKEEFSRLQGGLAVLQLIAPRSLLIGTQFSIGDFCPGRMINDDLDELLKSSNRVRIDCGQLLVLVVESGLQCNPVVREAQERRH